MRASAINQSSWSLFNKLIVVDELARMIVNRRLRDSKSALQVPWLLIEAAQLSLFFNTGRKIIIKALASTRFNHCNGKIRSLIR